MNLYDPIVQSFKVTYNYKLYFTNHLFSTDNELFNSILESYKPQELTKVLFVLDSNVNKLHPELEKQIKAYCEYYTNNIKHTELIVVPGGEQSKNDSILVDDILRGIDKNKICRHSFVVVIGGGAVIDMVGYAAAIAHRGVKLIRIPTTVLSQNDAAVGVKNSVNLLNKKNFLGTFATPYAIINDSIFLDTLQERDWVSGIAEAIKVALVRDKVFFKFIQDNAEVLYKRDKETMQYLIYKCAKLHMEHIAQGGDPFESGSSRPLDFGHWAAHKLEYMTNYQLRHGEAVAIGMAIDLTYAYLINLIDFNTLESILKVIENVGFNLDLPITSENELQKLLGGIEEFREHLGGQLTITLISKIGTKNDVHYIDMNKMQQAIKMLPTLLKENN
ncbi:3-dehydroquinate synthase [Winogradskyella sp. PG-2]|uniref:3-dehydroquinate synthase n=1 Tax=Winogradskyella sp. PG-2 TaxID=754409 RepID=UPI00045885F3|nr:3-dehydroquinate synthase [Winogradskyella sp. PG-2]BAO75277.1 3-dehydroquinate synthase [Winogradskyella sp. PG-2]